MLFALDTKSPKTVYQQIVDRVKGDIARGALIPGDRLPTIRELAARLRVNRNTVGRSYRELEQEGVIYTKPGGGSFVNEMSSDIQMKERIRILEDMARDLVIQAYHFQINNRGLIDILKREIDRIQRGQD